MASPLAALRAQLGARTGHKLGGVFALSSYLNDEAAAYKLIECSGGGASYPPVFMRHGAADGFIRTEWGQRTAERLSALGVTVDFATVPLLAHQLAPAEMDALRGWLAERLEL